jgi:hypothetical protein
MVPKKGLSGSSDGYNPFWIRRFYCKRTGKTVSVHPTFSHSYKRYVLAFVIECLSKLVENGRSICSVAKEQGVPRQTLRRWKRGLFFLNAVAKWVCFFHGKGLPAGDSVLSVALMRYFHQCGNNDLSQGTVLAMICLHERFSCGLY